MISVTWMHQHKLISECVNNILCSVPDTDVLHDQIRDDITRLSTLLQACVPATHARRVIKQFEKYVQAMHTVCDKPFSVKKQQTSEYHMQQLVAHIHAQPVTCISDYDLMHRWQDYHDSVISYLQYRSNKNFGAECAAHARLCVCSVSISNCVSNVMIDACVQMLCE